MPRAEKYPFVDLKLGQSFVVECEPQELDDVQNRLSVTAATHHKHPHNFCRWTVRRAINGCVVTRIA